MKTSAPALFLKHQLLKIFTFTLLVAAPAFPQSQFKVLYEFNGTDGSWPQSVIFDHAGNLYGTTAFGGNTASDCNRMGCGTVFELVRNPDGTWTETVLYAFCSVGTNCTDGYNPTTALLFDAAGNLYGTTLSGGANGWGEVYELTPNGQGQPWTANVLYSFCPLPFCSDGSDPSGALAMDEAGNLYGTTASGGANNFNGTVFELSPPLAQGDPWTESVLYNFCSDMNGKQCLDGFNPVGGIALSGGNLYGTTAQGGRYLGSCFAGCGTVFELSPVSGGWNYTLLYAPVPAVGEDPLAPLLVTPSGSVYGSFSDAGENGPGALFRLSANGERSAFILVSGEGDKPVGPLVLGHDVVYGAANGSGSDDRGTIFQITGSRQESVLHTFCLQQGCPDGVSPQGLTKDGAGVLFGTANGGGSSNNGVIFALKP